MADFPTLSTLRNSQIEIEDGRALDYASNGKQRGRILFSAPKHTFNLRLVVDSTDETSLLNHYTAHDNLAFNYAWPDDGVNYTVRYLSRPVPIEFGVSHRVYEVMLEGYAA